MLAWCVRTNEVHSSMSCITFELLQGPMRFILIGQAGITGLLFFEQINTWILFIIICWSYEVIAPRLKIQNKLLDSYVFFVFFLLLSLLLTLSFFLWTFWSVRHRQFSDLIKSLFICFRKIKKIISGWWMFLVLFLAIHWCTLYLRRRICLHFVSSDNYNNLLFIRPFF